MVSLRKATREKGFNRANSKEWTSHAISILILYRNQNKFFYCFNIAMNNAMKYVVFRMYVHIVCYNDMPAFKCKT